MKKQYIHVNDLDDIFNRMKMANTAALAVFIALESGPNRPEELIPGLYAVIDYQDILLKQMGETLRYEDGQIDS